MLISKIRNSKEKEKISGPTKNIKSYLYILQISFRSVATLQVCENTLKNYKLAILTNLVSSSFKPLHSKYSLQA